MKHKCLDLDGSEGAFGLYTPSSTKSCAHLVGLIIEGLRCRHRPHTPLCLVFSPVTKGDPLNHGLADIIFPSGDPGVSSGSTGRVFIGSDDQSGK